MNDKIAVLPGDGIGPEIVEQAVKVLKATGKKYGHILSFTEAKVGAAAIMPPEILSRMILTVCAWIRMPFFSVQSAIPKYR